MPKSEDDKSSVSTPSVDPLFHAEDDDQENDEEAKKPFGIGKHDRDGTCGCLTGFWSGGRSDDSDDRKPPVVPPREPVVLNVYDLLWTNKISSKLGMGIYHSGLQVHVPRGV